MDLDSRQEGMLQGRRSEKLQRRHLRCGNERRPGIFVPSYLLFRIKFPLCMCYHYADQTNRNVSELWCYWMLLHCALNTVIDVVCSVSLSEADECSFALGTGSQQEWHRANEPAEIRKGRGYGQLDILKWSKRFAQSQTALLCRAHIRKCLLLLEFKTLKLVFEPGLRRLLLKRTLTFGLSALIVT